MTDSCRAGNKAPRRSVGLAIVFALLFAVVSLAPAGAQIDCSLPTPWPDGCSISSHFPLWAEKGLDGIFLGACNNHDLCYGTCGASKSGCDLAMLADMEFACAFWATQVALPFSDDLQTAEQFVTYCNGVVAPAMYGILLVFGQTAFNKDQCVRCCDINACNSASCTIPGYCYPPPDPCLGAECGGCSCDPYCCGYCSFNISPPGAAQKSSIAPGSATPSPGDFLRSLAGGNAAAPPR